MKQRLRQMFTSPFDMLPIVALLVVFISGFSTYYTVVGNERDVELVSMIEGQQLEREWRSIEETLEYGMNLYRQNSRILAIKLEYELRNNYPDLSLLYSQMVSGVYDDEFYDILKDVLYDSDIKDRINSRPFLKMVGTEDHIIAFYSNHLDNAAASLDSTYAKRGSTVSWQDISDNINPSLSREAMQAIMDRSTKLIFTQVSEFDRSKPLKRMNTDNLKSLFFRGGINEFKHIEILAPSYITETGDIFGTEDHSGFRKNKNYKIVIVQSVNAYQLLERHRDLFGEADTEIERSFKYVKDINNEKIFSSVLMSLILFIMAIFLLVVYNSEMRRRVNIGECLGEEKHENMPRGE